MSDEAVVRIVLDSSKSGGGGAKPPSPTSTQSAPVTPQPSSQQPPQQQITTAPQRDWVKDLIEGIAGANRHVLIEGQSGSGKSLLTRHIAFERMQRGEEVNVVDVHTPEAWKGAKQVFQGAAAGNEAAAFLKEALEARKQEAQEAKLRGEQPQFKDMTIVLSDFARLMKDSPGLRDEFKTLMTEARKFRISIVADTTALTGAATGIKGIQDVINNFSQKVKLAAPTTETPHRTAETGGEVFQTPILPEYKERIDYGLVRPYQPPPPEPEVGPEARELKEAQSHARLLATIARLDKEANRQKEIDSLKEEAREQAAAESHVRLLLKVAQLDREIKEKEEAREKAAAESHARLLIRVAQLDREAKEKEKKRIEALPEALPVFDPVKAAKQRLESEKQSKQVEEEYKKLNPRSALDRIMDVLGNVRGTIGGLGGTLLGSGLDVMAATKGAEGTDGAGMAAAASLGAVAAAGTAVVIGFKAISAELDKAVQKYAEVSAPVAQAQAIAEVKDVIADIQRGSKYSKELADYAASSQAMQQKWEDTKMKFIARMEPSIELMMDTLGKIAEVVEFGLDIIEDTGQKIGRMGRALTDLVNLTDKKEERKGEQVKDPADDIFEGDPGAAIFDP